MEKQRSLLLFAILDFSTFLVLFEHHADIWFRRPFPQGCLTPPFSTIVSESSKPELNAVHRTSKHVNAALRCFIRVVEVMEDYMVARWLFRLS